jgi:hypothetical protein
MKRRPSISGGERDQARTAFTQILDDLLRVAPGAVGVAVVDPIGETVDYAGRLPAFDIKVAAAHFRLILDVARSRGATALGSPLHIAVRTKGRGYVIRPLLEGYALVVLLARGAFRTSSRALAIAERALCHEAGWPTPPQAPPVWHAVEVQASERVHRPLQLRTGSDWERVVVLGTVVGLGRDRGYRVRLSSGAELTLVREPLGHWFMDEPIGCPSDGGSSGNETAIRR